MEKLLVTGKKTTLSNMRPDKPPSLDAFYAAISRRLRRQGVPCAITGGLACVEFGVADHTEDCDLICPAAHAGTLLKVLQSSPYGKAACHYRKTSPPLAARWLAGGYTAHFHWPMGGAEKPFLDVFGVPPRVSSPWEKETVGRFAGRHTVAEMKRTNRRKDWDQATALGLAMLKQNDRRGWLHLFDATVLRALIQKQSPGPAELKRRPVLKLAQANSPLLERAIQTEVDFWTRLNELRLRIYLEQGEPYARALLKAEKAGPKDLMAQHELRVQLAESLLPEHPLQDHGIDRLIAEARRATAIGLDPALLRYLPEMAWHFKYLTPIS
jgi:hypothetical protein